MTRSGRIVQPYFLPRRVADLGERDPVGGPQTWSTSWRDRGAVDLAEELAWPMPFDVFFHVMGLPSRQEQDPELLARRDQLERWTHELKDRVPGTPHLTPVARAATAGVQQYFIDLLEERRRQGRDDLVTHFVRSDIDGVPFVSQQVTPTSEVSGLMLVLYLGGVESTAGLTGTLFKLLAENPEQRALLQHDPTLIPAAIEEALRLITPLQLTARSDVPRGDACTASPFPPGTGSCWSPALPTATSGSSRTRTGSTSPGARTGTSASARACTAASARRWPGSRHGSHWRRRCRCWATTNSPAPRRSIPARRTCTSGRGCRSSVRQREPDGGARRPAVPRRGGADTGRRA